MKKALLAVALTLTFPPVFAEKKTPTYDVAQFDIAGMKLGMTESRNQSRDQNLFGDE